MRQVEPTCGETDISKDLKQELQQLLDKKKQLKNKIENLISQVSSKEASLVPLERALTDSKKVAREIEAEAIQRAELILEDTKNIVLDKQRFIQSLDLEIAKLTRELDLYHQMVSAMAALDHNSTCEKKGTVLENSSCIRIREINTQSKDSLYTIKMVSFLNARHFVILKGNAGPVHAHSWQVQINAKVNSDNPEFVAFSRVIDAIKTVFVQYENTVINEIYPFTIIQPTTENIALYFYNRLQDNLAELGLILELISVWETPTRGIEVTKRYTQFDHLLQKAEQTQVYMEFQREAAAGIESTPYLAMTGENTEDVVDTGALKASPPNAKKYTPLHWFAAFGIIGLVAVTASFFLFMINAWQFPTLGADTLVYLNQAEYLNQQILRGNYFPEFFEYSYAEFKPTIYWGSLAHYLLALLLSITGSKILAANYFILLCNLIGGLSCLLMNRRIGLRASTMLGVLWTIWPINLHLALVQGNMPGFMAVIMLPLLLEMYMRTLDRKATVVPAIITVLALQIVILNQAFTGVTYSLCLLLFTLLLWIFQSCTYRDCLRGVFILVAGIGIASWWVLPMLSNHFAMDTFQAGAGFIPAFSALNPFQRLSDPGSFYFGAGLLLIILISFLTWRLKSSWAKGLITCGILLMLLTFPSLEPVYNLLPLSHLTWPMYIASFASFSLLAGAFTFELNNQKHWMLRHKYVLPTLISVVFTLLLLDCALSQNALTKTKQAGAILPWQEMIKDSEGWHTSLINLSKVPSSPSYLMSLTPGLDRGIGWAWQGDWASKRISFTNYGLEQQKYSFLIRSCLYLGMSDMVVGEASLINAVEFQKAATFAGYRQLKKNGSYSLWSNGYGPYLVEKNYKCLVVGKYAGVVGLLFPEAEIGVSTCIDDYSPDFLAKYPLLLLTGAQWRVKSKAEEQVKEYAASGGQVVIEMTGMSENALSRTPEFLGVSGEPVLLDSNLEIFGQGKNIIIPLWQGTSGKNYSAPANLDKVTSFIPLGLDKIELEFSYQGNQAPVYGYKMSSGKKIWFLGTNLIHQAYLTGDKVTLDLLKEILGLSSQYPVPNIIPLSQFEITGNSYIIGYNSDRKLETILPVVAHDDMKITIDGYSTIGGKFENLLLLELPAGEHEIIIEHRLTPVQRWGVGISAAGLLLVGVFIMFIKRAGDAR